MDEDVAVVLELRMQRDRPQPLFDKPGLYVGTQRIKVGEIDERFGLNLAVLVDDPDATGPFDNEDAS